MGYKFLLKTTAKLREVEFNKYHRANSLKNQNQNLSSLIPAFMFLLLHHKYDHLLLKFPIFAQTSGWSWAPVCQYPSWG